MTFKQDDWQYERDMEDIEIQASMNAYHPITKPRVVNIRTAKKGSYVYCGRKPESKYHFGNPFNIKWENQREWSCAQFYTWIYKIDHFNVEPERRQWILDNLVLLAGKDLGCYCAPQQCHCDTLLILANNLKERNNETS
jgi:hypothetical protein